MSEASPPIVIDQPPVEATYAVSANQKSDDEQLAEGRRMLAANLTRLLTDSGSKVTSAYLNDILANTEGKAPASERQAAFNLLATEQKNIIRQSLIDSGQHVLSSLIENSEAVGQRVADTARTTTNQVNALAEIHYQEVGRHFRNGVDTRRAALGQELVEQRSRGAVRRLGEYTDSVQSWARTQTDGIDGYLGDVGKARQQEFALAEAATSIQPSYDGKPKELTPLVSERAMSLTSEKLHHAMSMAIENGTDPTETVVNLLAGWTEVSPKPITMLNEALSEYGASVRGVAGRSKGKQEDVDQLFRIFNRNGREGYQHARGVQEAVGFYRSQTHRLGTVISEAGTLIRTSAKPVEASSGNLRTIQLTISRRA